MKVLKKYTPAQMKIQFPYLTNTIEAKLIA